MKKVIALLLLLNLAQLPAAWSQTTSSHQKAAEQMLSLMDMEAIMARSLDQMLKAQIEVNPSIAPYEKVMKQFFAKYMSWNSLKPDVVKLYMEEFSEQELNEITKFYQTPTGKKALSSMPNVITKANQIAVQRVQKNMPELQAAIAEEAKKQPGGEQKK